MRFTFILYILLLVSLKNIAQTKLQATAKYFIFNNYNGLQSNTVFNMHKGKNGLIYIAHSKGLSSFDGTNFINYYNTRYAFSEVTNIMEDDNGRIFCKVFNNSIYYINNLDSLEFLSHLFTNNGFEPSIINGNTLYGMRMDTLIKINTTTLKESKLKIPTNLPSIKPPYIYLAKWDSIKSVVINKNKQVGLIDNTILKSVNSHISKGEIYTVENKKTTSIYSINNGTYFNKVSLNDDLVNYITATDNNVYICTNNGVFYRTKSNTTQPWLVILKDFNTTCVQEVGNGLLISTLDKGLVYIPNTNVRILQTSNSNSIQVTSNNNKISIGNKNGTLETIDFTTNYILSKKVSNYPIDYIITNKNNTLILSNSALQNGEKFGSIKDYCYLNNNLLIANIGGLFYYPNNNNKHWIQKFCSTPLTQNKFNHLQLSQEHTSSVKYDSIHDVIYINNYKGIFKVTATSTKLDPMPEPYCALKDMIVYEGSLYLATKDKGLLIYTGTGYKPAPIAKNIKGILLKMLVHKNELWIQGEEAIYCIKNNTLLTYNQYIGINPSLIKQFTVTDSNIVVIENDQIVVFPKNINLQETITNPFMLNFVRVGNKKIEHNAILTVNQNTLEFTYSHITFGLNGNAKLYYTVNNGLPIELKSNSNTFKLNYLKPDDYTVQFFTENNEHKKLVYTFNFNIKPHWYNTYLFYTILLVFISLATFLLYKRRLNNIKKENAKENAKLALEKEIDKQKLANLKSQMNPHFLFNAMNTIQSFIYQNNTEKATEYLGMFSDLTRRILEMSNEEMVTLENELQTLTLYLNLEQMRFPDTLTYNINLDPLLDLYGTTLPSMLIQPFIENAIKHGLMHKQADRNLQLTFTKDNNYLIVNITDNGIGRKASDAINKRRNKNHKSFSSAANMQRINLLNSSAANKYSLEILDNTNDVGTAIGTTVLINIPI